MRHQASEKMRYVKNEVFKEWGMWRLYMRRHSCYKGEVCADWYELETTEVYEDCGIWFTSKSGLIKKMGNWQNSSKLWALSQNLKKGPFVCSIGPKQTYWNLCLSETLVASWSKLFSSYCLNFSLLQKDLFFLILSTEVDKVLPRDFCFTNSNWRLLAGSTFSGLRIFLELVAVKPVWPNWPHLTLPDSNCALNLLTPLVKSSAEEKASNCLNSSELGRILGSELSLNNGGGFLKVSKELCFLVIFLLASMLPNPLLFRGFLLFKHTLARFI